MSFSFQENPFSNRTIRIGPFMEHHHNPVELAEESHKSINDYLDAVEQVLLEQKVSRSERTLILGELESQIHSMIAAKSDSGASGSLSTVLSVLDTLDAPDSYRRAEPMSDSLSKESNTEPLDSQVPLESHVHFGKASEKSTSVERDEASKADASNVERPSASESPNKEPSKVKLPWFTMPDVRSRAQAVRAKTLSYMNRSRMDEFAIFSCVSSLMAFFMALASRRNEGMAAFAVFLLIVGCGAGWYSVYRIKRSEGKLWGGRWAFAGAMVLPVLLLNAVAVLLVLETRLWVLLLAVAVLYVNYRLIQRVWSWIACQRMTHRPEVIIVEPPVSLGSGESVPAM
jgi:hypothetical protein